MNRPPLLQTKLQPPPSPPGLVPRPQLIARLTGGVAGKLTLVAAPAGFGKTTLVRTWLQQSQLPTAWLALDETLQNRLLSLRAAHKYGRGKARADEAPVNPIKNAEAAAPRVIHAHLGTRVGSL